MEIQDRPTQEAVDKIAAMLAAAYRKWLRARRATGAIASIDRRELDNTRPESLHVHEVDA
jgi:DNA-binding MurR/RpiR family transcriptional regulator